MKVFAVRNEEDYSRKDLAYLIYYENAKVFYIELPDDADEWETPLLLSSFLKKGETTVNAYWSREWVRQRIVPEDRQNLGQVLKENGLDEYDEYALLMKGMGRCAQDSFYLAPADEEVIEDRFPERFKRKVDEAVPLSGNMCLVFFRNGEAKKCDIDAMVNGVRFFIPVLKSRAVFNNVSVQTGGYGICWGAGAEISDKLLYESGESVPLSKDDLISFIESRVVGSAEAAQELACTRQNLSELTRRGRLRTIRAGKKTTLYLKGEIEQRMWK